MNQAQHLPAEVIQSVNRTQHLPTVLVQTGQVSKGPGLGAWQRGGRGHTSNLTEANAVQVRRPPMLLQPITEVETRGVVNDDQANCNPNHNPYGNHTGRSKSVFRDGLMTSAVRKLKACCRKPANSVGGTRWATIPQRREQRCRQRST